MLKVRDIMTREPITVTPGTSLRDAMELFTREHISGAPVSSGGKLVGVISASDLLAFAAASPEAARGPDAEAEFDDLPDMDDEAGIELAGDALSDGAFFTDFLNDADTEVDMRFAGMSDSNMDVLDEYTVADAMTTKVKTIGADEPAIAAARMMQEAKVHRLLVMDHDRLAGIVSTTDLNRAVAERRLPEIAPPADGSVNFDAGWTHEPLVPYDDAE
ncbi:MAG: CBS domain-containing protein [Gemmatimonadaceae bacterium]